MAEKIDNLVLRHLREMRTDAKAFRKETHANFGKVFHRLSLVEARLTSLEKHMAALLAVVPAMNERMDGFEVRLAALEARLSG
jgi:hypothetical protein